MRPAVLALGASLIASTAHADIETSWRVAGWSGDRMSRAEEGPVANAEAWIRAGAPSSDGASLRFEAWVAADPVGHDEADADIREASITVTPGPLRLTAGRQVHAWGRSDRINPTDVIGARDLRRLTEDDGDNRLGAAGASAQLDLAGGVASLHWLPEFRANRLPITLPAPEIRDRPGNTEGQFALRYERYGQALDWSISYADLADRTPWLDLGLAAGRPQIILRHPRLRMLGGDLATTLGPYGVRAEAALYHYDRSDLTGLALRRPRFALVLGADRDLPGQLNLNVQTVLRANDTQPAPPGPKAATALRNAAIQYAWRDTVVGATVRLRKPFAAERGSVEATVAAYAGGGTYAQIRLTYALRDGLRASLLAERFAGRSDSLFGRLEDNSLIAVGLRAGF
ncbi:DUF1302 family protein [Phenylobacterium sp.]|uniref:DUF1302 family protein n=1 Tax=Phenylobacterium sp. TaxID=1871053 RepID=UPI00286A8CE4|nr:DUF1302 family protein [Phenylobacterium sp.]